MLDASTRGIHDRMAHLMSAVGRVAWISSRMDTNSSSSSLKKVRCVSYLVAQRVNEDIETHTILAIFVF